MREDIDTYILATPKWKLGFHEDFIRRDWERSVADRVSRKRKHIETREKAVAYTGLVLPLVVNIYLKLAGWL